MNYMKRFWEFLKEDTWKSWIVSLILLVVLIRFILFPSLSLITASPLPLVVVESCSMYHESDFDEWWSKNSEWYKQKGISKGEFESFSIKNGLNKGDIIFVWGRSEYKEGDIIIFTAESKFNLRHPIIHRIVGVDPISTKGDNGRTNPTSAEFERDIPDSVVMGKAAVRIPALGWIKLVFFEPLRPEGQRGLCR